MCVAGFQPPPIPLSQKRVRSGIRRASATSVGQRPAHAPRPTPKTSDLTLPFTTDLEARWFWEMYHQSVVHRAQPHWENFSMMFNVRVSEHWMQHGGPCDVYYKTPKHLMDYGKRMTANACDHLLNKMQAAASGHAGHTRPVQPHQTASYQQPSPGWQQPVAAQASQPSSVSAPSHPTTGGQPSHAQQACQPPCQRPNAAHDPAAVRPLVYMTSPFMHAARMQIRPPHGSGRGGKNGPKRCLRCTQLAESLRLGLPFIGKAKPHCYWCFHQFHSPSMQFLDVPCCDLSKCGCSFCQAWAQRR